MSKSQVLQAIKEKYEEVASFHDIYIVDERKNSLERSHFRNFLFTETKKLFKIL